jgi:hypothetical protein
MNTQTQFVATRVTVSVQGDSASRAESFSEISAAFGLAAAITILFNTLLAWVKDAYDPLNTAMAHLTGHHWITHGLVDIAVFVVLGFVFMSTGIARRIDPSRLVIELVGASVVAGLGLAAWFVLT